MLLLGSEDENHKELHDCAKQIRCNPKDMVKVPGMDATFRLPNGLYPAEGLDFTNSYYNKLRDKMYRWGRGKGLLITRKVLYGPQIFWLKDGGSIYVKENRLLICVVIPNLSEHQLAEEDCGYRGPTAETSVVSQAGASGVDLGALPRVRVSITSPVSHGFAGRSFPDLEIGDIIILEEGERLLVDAGSICLISTLHITSSGMAGEGGWKEDTVKRDKGNPPAI
ncbi:hypothetical protein Forpi1262_v018690 [Fusarium oxysporum f. sp. raphani]|uniref:Uncharacterized protein n=1 Tax=Fusarium oxysporum f. sp. raphani TaxID=96318 RepID=A0A8J5TY37_FUSOX|nr:hypothetical protein FocnCong_v020902 [Fusarium oxysporum f. sp. conglutinans]KAG6989457.1 hypothetical protein FocnCong_v020974 [Fusarium oxysporum f. sp. conglutinans]KAG7403927.1 hypothetical protein Forpi1262_v018690 [Fusarium oxysporum f. sp. raphani]